MESAICNKLGSRECPCQMTNSNVQSCPCKMRYSTKYTVRKLFSKPYFSHPFEIIPINQEDINEKIHIHIKSDKIRNRISGKYFNHNKPFSMRTTYKFESNHEKWRVLSQHHYNTLRQKNIVLSLKERCSLLLLNTFPFTKVVHEDHPKLVTENLRATTYKYYLHVYLNLKPPYHKYIIKIIYEIELNPEKLELKYKKDSLKDCIFKKNPDSGKIKLLMTDKNLIVVDALYKHWLSPSSYITVSSEPRLYNPMIPELLVNSHINGTAIYVYASMVGSHNLIPFSPVRTTIPQVFLNRISQHNWKTWLEESLTKLPQISIHYQRYLHQSIKHVQKIFTKEKLKHHYEK